MSSLAPLLEEFFTDRLVGQRHASPNTIASYRDTMRLLLAFTEHRIGKQPSKLDIADLDAKLIDAFLDHLERERGNSTRTRNARLAAIHSLYRYAALRHPEHSGLIQRVLAIPEKRSETQLVSFLTEPEVNALLGAPDRSTWTGRRDHALLVLAIQTGLRASELTGLDRGSIELGTGKHVRCRGKARKNRITPLTAQTVAVLRVWLAERNGEPTDPLFPTRPGHRLSRDSVEHLVAKHLATARQHCPSLRGKRISPHTLRHTTAMRLLEAGVDRSVIALWLGHEHQNHRDLPTRPPRAQRTSTHQNRAPKHDRRTLQAARHPARLPRRALKRPDRYAERFTPRRRPEQGKRRSHASSSA